MRAVLPGRPQASLQAVSIALWDSRRLIAYTSGNAFVILSEADTIIQTIYDDDTTELRAISIDESSGKISTSTGSSVRIYKPYGQHEEALKWSLQWTISPDYEISSLSWGLGEELLVGGTSLTLYSTFETPKPLWQSKLANPVKHASFSHDSEYIASTGKYDRLVKIWRRLSYGSDEVRFDFSYLLHPKTVADLFWRKSRPGQSIDNVLYTVCADNIFRVWVATDQHGLQMMQSWGEIDLGISIQIRGLDDQHLSARRHVFVIDGRNFSTATELAVQNAENVEHSQSLEHLIEIANRSPEICVILDDYGNMSAWAMENISFKQKTPSIFNVAHVHGLPVQLHSALRKTEYARIYNYCDPSEGGLNLLLHRFDGCIEVYEANLADLFAPFYTKERISRKAIWTGHCGPIKKIVRNVSGDTIVSRTDSHEGIVWRQSASNGGASLVRQSIITAPEHVHRICVLRNGNFVIFLHHTRITLWDCRHPSSRLVAEAEYTISGKSLCILILPDVECQPSVVHIATISSKMKGVVWEVRLPQDKGSIQRSKITNGHASGSIQEFCTFDLGVTGDLAYVLPVDPAGSQSMISGFLDTFARDVALSYTHSGLLSSWTAKVSVQERRVDWLLTCSVETGIINPALANGSSIRKAALVNASKTELTIWDVRGERLEYTQDFSGRDTVQDLDWTSTPDDQSILAVGFPHRVLLLSQLRYDYLDKGPAWAPIRELHIRDLTPHPIGDSTWLSGGNLIIGSGNQLFLYDRSVSPTATVLSNLRLPHGKVADLDLFDVVTRLNGSLPVFHPQFLSQCILVGKTILVQQILLRLHRILKYRVEDEPVDNLLGMNLEDFYTDRGVSASSSTARVKSTFFELSSKDEDDEETLTDAVASALNDKLMHVTIPQLSGREQIHLIDIVECVALVEKQRRSMDDNAARYMLFFRQHALHKGRYNEVNLSWRETNWAFHSNSQDILVDMISNQFHGKLLWENARECGIFMWLQDVSTLTMQFEAVARNEYSKTDMRNPIDCSLFYFALKKKAVVQGLWRMASWNREQAATMKLLSNNFQDPKWKTVALKNAYALLGKRRFEYAAAFFLLADCLKDAVNVCLHQLKDLQLAIAIARVYEGDHGQVLRELLEEQILPLATQEGNRWLASWAFWMLNRRDMAVRTLISPVASIRETPQSPDLQAKLFLTDDPALVVLYSQLRHKTLQTIRGSSKITPRTEWGFVLHSAQLYDRMGCDILALDLVRNWEFLLPAPKTDTLLTDSDPRRLLRRRGSLVVADLPTRPFNIESKTPAVGKPTPSAFVEPEANSLLDNFGF